MLNSLLSKNVLAFSQINFKHHEKGQSKNRKKRAKDLKSQRRRKQKKGKKQFRQKDYTEKVTTECGDTIPTPERKMVDGAGIEPATLCV